MAEQTFDLTKLSDNKLQDLLDQYKITLTLDEAKKVQKEILKRPPTLSELVAFGIEGSEHTSYKSSREYLKLLPTKAPNVILGPKEDAGIIEIDEIDGEKYGIVIGHESHNHPSQIVPYEGAATGVGGIVRDIACMGAKVIASADPLRFGGIETNKAKWLHERVVAGISGYGNPLGVANLAGDVYYNESFNNNCLVNVAALGVIKESDIIHSEAPENSEGFEYVLVGKPTDNSGFGGAAFASLELDEDEKEQNKGAVQEPNAFLERHLLESTLDLIKTLKKKKLINKVGFKDLGAGGVLCASVELADAAGYGAHIDLDEVHISIPDLDPFIYLSSETQERFMWVAEPKVAKMIVEHYNKKWALPKVSEGAQASIIGKVQTGNYQVFWEGEKILDAKASDVTEGLKYKRKIQKMEKKLKEPKLKEPDDYNATLLELLKHENIANRKCVYENYDKHVQGLTVIESGMADAGVMAPLLDLKSKVGIALSVDGNPKYGRIDPYWQGANAVVEAMRNVAAVGAKPWCLTDCLCYGNPEKPNQMWQFVEGVKGVADAASNVHLKGFGGAPTPIVSGNVSFYNQSKEGAIDPSAIIACLGKLDDYEKAIEMNFIGPGNSVYLIGPRKDELGGSTYYDINRELGKNVPHPDFPQVEKEIFALTDAIDNEFILTAHDISDGGMAVTLSEMCLGGRGEGRVGVDIDLAKVPDEKLSNDKKLFSETGGFVIEVAPGNEKETMEVFQKHGVEIYRIGSTIAEAEFRIKYGEEEVINLNVGEMADAWLNGLRNRF
ncbi:phosphoribosylformylglycinamidine synthase subunit PurL [Patescibacteria group bacterium]|nr:phosphoribosylformylglycinamidine synthase subunit PurL [Patescibacteria group bacterium]MBU1673341.1 phosphoribosylformylglycinamidine synthase subunit PurL [Patescibacteria group bacterium]MBU1963540.1 phosphoribosylformylglycinamidine synthase subunit PurL [Patescibacteria group bacterium]